MTYQQIRRSYDLANYHYQHSKDKEAELLALREVLVLVNQRIRVLLKG